MVINHLATVYSIDLRFMARRWLQIESCIFKTSLMPLYG